MFIDDYRFGQITISGQVYNRDVIILPDRVLSPWRRQQGHLLMPDDLGRIMEASPEVILIGTGNSGLLRVAAETLDYLGGQGIEIFSYPTATAAHLYNSTPKCQVVVAAFHLTC